METFETKFIAKIPQNIKNPCSMAIHEFLPLKDEGPFLAHFWTSGRSLWMQYLSKKSQIFGEHVV
jgi:hypothetical protein